MGECWKWTNAAQQTLGRSPPSSFEWGEGVSHTVVPWRGALCEPGVIHCCDDPILAVMMDPAHVQYSSGGGLLWLCEWSGRTVAAADKRGVETLRTLHVVAPPVLMTEQRVEIGLRAVLVVLSAARRWADGAGRGDVLASLDVVAAWAARWLDGADRSAGAAASTRDAAFAVGEAAGAAVSAADAAGMAADAAGRAGIPLDLVAICREVARGNKR